MDSAQDNFSGTVKITKADMLVKKWLRQDLKCNKYNFPKISNNCCKFQSCVIWQYCTNQLTINNKCHQVGYDLVIWSHQVGFDLVIRNDAGKRYAYSSLKVEIRSFLYHLINSSSVFLIWDNKNWCFTSF